MLPGKQSACAASLRRRASRNSCKGQYVTAHYGSCDSPPFFNFFNFACLSLEAEVKFYDYFISLGQSTGHVQVYITSAVYWACAGLYR